MSNEECPASRKSLFAVSSSRLAGLRFSILFESMENNDINHGGFQQLKKQASVDKYTQEKKAVFLRFSNYLEKVYK